MKRNDGRSTPCIAFLFNLLLSIGDMVWGKGGRGGKKEREMHVREERKEQGEWGWRGRGWIVVMSDRTREKWRGDGGHL